MDEIQCNYTFMVASIMSIFKDRYDNYGREVEGRKTKNEEISFREVLNREIHKNNT